MTSWTPHLATDKPRYIAIADAIAADLASGKLKLGDRLPPQRQLAWQLGRDIGDCYPGLSGGRKARLAERRSRPRQLCAIARARCPHCRRVRSDNAGHAGVLAAARHSQGRVRCRTARAHEQQQLAIAIRLSLDRRAETRNAPPARAGSGPLELTFRPAASCSRRERKRRLSPAFRHWRALAIAC